MMIPPLVFSSSSMRLTRIRSCSGRIFMAVPPMPMRRGAAARDATRRCLSRAPRPGPPWPGCRLARVLGSLDVSSAKTAAQCMTGPSASRKTAMARAAICGPVDFRLGFATLRPVALTRRQREIYDFVREFVDERGYSPSLEEIGARFGLSSVATVHKHVQHLVEKGYLRKALNRSRSVEPVETPAGPGGLAAAARQRRGRRADRGDRGAPSRSTCRSSSCRAAAAASCCACAATR